MANTYFKLGSVTAAGGETILTLDSLSGSYTDLLIWWSGRDTRTTANFNNIQLKVNDATTNYSERIFYGLGSGSTPTGASGSSAFLNYIYTDTSALGSNWFGATCIYISGYSSSNPKYFYCWSNSAGNSGTQIQAMTTARWNSSSAITKVTINVDGANTFVAGSEAQIYGIKNA